MNLELSGKTALVTGGSKGIGLATALVLAEEGCNVGICGRDESSLIEAVKKIRQFDVEVESVIADVCDKTQSSEFVQRCVETLGGVDILINNVGGSFGAPRIIDGDLNDWRQTFEINLFQGINLIKLVEPFMATKGGSIVNVASISGWSEQLAGSGQYGSAKAALIFATERMALELVQSNIRVNTVSPGSILGAGGWDKMAHEAAEQFMEYVKEGFPMGRLGLPYEIANVIAFLVSPKAHWINGRNIPVDGLQQPVPVRSRRPW
ncbi:SDR family oxidoreductase [SAR202 cluster bacterium AC-409-J13_OGT_754m]|nr:SDR family oxidoreductase [SAR202 cluster bacterium AC-409-J13_OGT_754m]